MCGLDRCTVTAVIVQLEDQLSLSEQNRCPFQCYWGCLQCFDTCTWVRGGVRMIPVLVVWYWAIFADIG